VGRTGILCPLCAQTPQSSEQGYVMGISISILREGHWGLAQGLLKSHYQYRARLGISRQMWLWTPQGVSALLLHSHPPGKALSLLDLSAMPDDQCLFLRLEQQDAKCSVHQMEVGDRNRRDLPLVALECLYP
jgi:hypothetical protein